MAKFDLTGHGLGSFDDARYIELLNRGANGHGLAISLRSGQMRMEPIKLPHLGVGAPAEITLLGVLEIGKGIEARP